MPKPKKEKKEAEYSCPYCKNKVPASQSEKVGNRYYHKDCYEKKQNEDVEKQRSADDYRSLIDYICTLYGISAPTGMILKQVKDFQQEYGYKLKGMELALRYFHETLENPVREDVGIGIIHYVYEDAKKDYILRRNVTEKLEEIDDELVRQKKVRVRFKELINQKKSNQIDISLL